MKTRPIEKRVVVVDEERCKGCWLCIDACRHDCLARASRFNSRGLLVVEVSDPDACNLCGLCAVVCPDLALATGEA